MSITAETAGASDVATESIPGAAVISARQVCYSFGSNELQKQILFDIDLDIHPGEVVLLTGPSGSGKTTLLTLIAALRSMQQGELYVLGTNLLGATKPQHHHLRRSIGFIFQQHNLLPFLTARQNVELMFQLHPEVSASDARRRAREILATVGLEDKLNQLPAALSGGQKQRIAIARALVCRPKLILADEPTAALDSHSGRNAVNLLVKLARETKSPVLMVTHDSRVLDVADRIIHFEDGRILRIDTP